MQKAGFLVFIIIFGLSFNVYATDDVQARQLARKIFEGSASSYNKESLTKVYVSGGYSEEEASSYAIKVMTLIKSDEFIKKIENTYIKHFTLIELEQISTMLEHPAFNKFIRLRPLIQQEMAAAINDVAVNSKKQLTKIRN
ncbi:MAG: DUF2059 domain-containing protein [Kangiellaceae bacterium]